MQSPLTTVAVDAMSGDRGTVVIVDAVRRVLERRDDVHLLLVGDADTIKKHMGNRPLPEGRYTIVEADQVVTMEDTAAVALRNKKTSSMRIAINMVKEGRAFDRPAICTTIPAIDGHTHMLDLGANIDCTAEHLYQFACMGSILAEAVDGVNAPKVGLLNIGSEEIKGNEQVKDAAQLLGDSALNYIGFVEGNEIYTDKVDVVVCDGFVGNISLKTSEGVARMVSHYLKEEFKRNPLNKLIGLAAMPILKAFRKRIDPRRYNGASLLGLQGVVIKSHGSADALAFANAIEIGLLASGSDVPTMISSQLSTAETAA